MFGVTCGAPDEVRRVRNVQSAGGDMGGPSGGLSSSSSDGTGGIGGGGTSTPSAGGSVDSGGARSSGSRAGAGGGSSTGGTGGSGGAGTTGAKGGTGGTGASGGRGGTGGPGAGGTGVGGAGGTGTSSNPFASGGAGGGGTTAVSSGGTGGTGDSGGSTSSSSAPPPPANSLQVWVLKKPTQSTGQIGLDLRVDNKTSTSVDMSTVVLRYWYQDEGLGTALVLSANYVSIGYSTQGKVTSGTAVVAPSSVAGADHYIELSFSGTLAAQGDKSTNDQFTIQVNLHTAGYTGAVDVTNDYSYDGGAEGLYENKITLYESSKLIWGIEPGTSSVGPADAGVDASASAGVGDSTDLEAS